MLSFAGTVLAENFNLKPGGLVTNVQNITIVGIVNAAVTLIFVIAVIIFFFMLVIGGVRWISSGGDKAATESARSQITAAIVGLVIVLAAWAIANLIEIFFGVSLFNGLAINGVPQP